VACISVGGNVCESAVGALIVKIARAIEKNPRTTGDKDDRSLAESKMRQVLYYFFSPGSASPPGGPDKTTTPLGRVALLKRASAGVIVRR